MDENGVENGYSVVCPVSLFELLVAVKVILSWVAEMISHLAVFEEVHYSRYIRQVYLQSRQSARELSELHRRL